MAAVIAQGPIHGSAPCALSPRLEQSARAVANFGSRRQIGTGPRAIIVTNPARITRRRIARPLARRPQMKRTTLFFTSIFAIALSLAALGISASMDMPSTLMSPAVYEQLKREVEADTRQALGNCRDARGPAREICRAEARSAERVKKAELNARYHGTVSAQDEIRLVRAKAAYDVAKARCAALPGDARYDCLRAARAEHTRALVQS
jgi:hypothetical protein